MLGWSTSRLITPQGGYLARRSTCGSPGHNAVQAYEWAESVVLDVRHTLRSLRRDWQLSIAVVLTLGLAIGANASMFGVLDRLLLSGPPHVQDAASLRRVYATSSSGGAPDQTTASFGYLTMVALRDEAPSLRQIAVYTDARDATLGRGVQAQRVRVRYASASLFPLLGTRPAIGRFLMPSDEEQSAGQLAAVLDHALWQESFGGDSTVVGRHFVLDGRVITVVGVAPEGFSGPELESTAIWMPVRASVDIGNWQTTRNAAWLRIVVRLAPGASIAIANAQATQVYRRERVRVAPGSRVRLELRPLSYDARGAEAPEISVSRWLVGVSVALLLVACANVTNLLLIRGLRRRHEVAVRVALGIRHWRLVRLLLLESALLTAAGGCVALFVAFWSNELLRVTLLAGISSDRPPLDTHVLLYTLCVTAMTAVLVGIVPALRPSRAELVADLKTGTVRSGASRSSLRTMLTVVQAALSVVLLVGAGLFIRSVWNIHRFDLGFDAEDLAMVAPIWPGIGALPDSAWATERVRRRDLREQALTRIRALPHVRAAALSIGAPLQGAGGVPIRVDGFDSLPHLAGGGTFPFVIVVSDGYFEAMRLRIVRGRTIKGEDREGTRPVAVINASMARALWPSVDPVGRCIFMHVDGARTNRDADRCVRVVGVVEDVLRSQIREDPAMQYYIPFAQEPSLADGDATIVVRYGGTIGSLTRAVRRELFTLDPSLLFVRVTRMEDALAPEIRSWNLGAIIFVLIGAVALAIAGIGLYSAVSYGVAQRLHELSVRIALGARPSDIGRRILRDGLLIVALGLASGLLLVVLAAPGLAPLLFETSPYDPIVLGSVGATLLITGVVAAVLPAFRASRISPIIALQSE